MPNRHLHLLLVFCALAAGPAAYGDSKLQFNPLMGSYTSGGVEFGYAASVSLGTHITGAGVSAAFMFATPIQAGELFLGYVETGAMLEFKHYVQYLGIPGDSDMATVGLTATYGLGRENRFPSTPFNHAGPGRHNFSYSFIWYLSTDGTSQSSAYVGYELAGDRSKLKIGMENDMLKLPIRDEFRTAAAELEFLHAFGSSVAGFSVGFMLWTGSTAGLTPPPGAVSFDLSGQYGAEYSSGIAFLSLIWGIARLSIGYDSEAIRDALQNTAHRIGNWYEIPRLDRPDRWYLQVSLGSVDTLYQ